MTKGKKIFVTYGNEVYYNSLYRIKKEVEQTKRFDEIRIYTDKDLPQSLLGHELFAHSRGGGYWLWKPWVVLDTLKDMQEDDILVYSDAGSKIFDHKEWDKWFRIMERKSALFFFYSGSMEKWARKSILEYFCSVKNLHSYYQLMSGLFLLRKSARHLIEEWYDVMRLYPEIVMDVDKRMMEYESPKFIENRHDQAVLSGVIYSHIRDRGIKIQHQNSEILLPEGQAVFTARISDSEQRNNSPVFSGYFGMIRKYIVKPLRYIRFYLVR